MEYNKPQILAVDDDEGFCLALETTLHDTFNVRCVTSGQGAFAALRELRPDLILLDMKLPDISGLELLKMLRQRFDEIPVVMLTGSIDIRSVVEAMKLGASEYVTKESPELGEELQIRIRQALERNRLLGRSRAMESKLVNHGREYELVGDSTPMLKLKANLLALRGQTATVLILGESGTGKEVLARNLNISSPDGHGRPFVAVNCAAIPENLIESELFGHEKGAFTGAVQKQQGKFQAADRGDILLDEVGELPLLMQAKLLRVLQEKEITPVGAVKSIPINVRVIAATNRDLREEVRAGRFREDLYYRLSVIQLHMPPLRERREDIPLLVTHFFKQFGAPYTRLSRDALTAVERHSWPGNIRALRNCLERAWILSQSQGRAAIEKDQIIFDDTNFGNSRSISVPPELLAEDSEDVSPENYQAFLKWSERIYFESAFNAVERSKKRLADQLSVSRMHIHRRFRALGLAETQNDSEEASL